ncbi:ABC transporter substrate-binding protein [Pseudorhodoplanes sp.]|uniref:ABC transporter substrate-binding protein n=1 Tax=Pseudorhodoplanes sp. TaxID=1934341 RepID=UPI003D11DFDF
MTVKQFPNEPVASLLSDRRRFLGGAAAAAALLASSARNAIANDKVVKVGMLLAMSGPLASIGESVLAGARLYQKTHEKELPAGVKVEMLLRDDAGNPDNTRRLAQELVVRERAQLLAGMSITPQAITVAPLATSTKVPVVIMSAATARVTRESPYFVRVANTFWQTSYTLGEWAAKNGHKRVYTLVADYASGHDVETAFSTGFKKNGGEIVGSVRVPVATTDFLPYMQRVKETNPDAMLLWVNAGRAVATIKAFTDTGLRQAGIKMLSTQDMSIDDELAKMSDDVLGLVTANFYQSHTNLPKNREFVSAWKQEHGAGSIPNFMAVSGWDGMAAIYALAKETKGAFDGEGALKFLSNWKTNDSPRGSLVIDPQTRDAVQTIYISRVEKVDGKPTAVVFDKIEEVKDPWKILNPA